MNLLLVLLLAVAAFFFINEGLVFIGFLAVIVLVLAVVAGGRKQASSAYGGGDGGPDVILEQEEPDIPSNIDIKVKPNWEANTLFEDMFAADGEMVDVIGRSVARFASGGQYGKPKGQSEDEPEF
jgi:hypothetical protein